MSYIVLTENKDGSHDEKTFSSYRESVCFATNFRRIKASKILKDKKVINKFHY